MTENKYTRALDYIYDKLVELEKKLGNEIGTTENVGLLWGAIEACKYRKQPEFDRRFAGRFAARRPETTVATDTEEDPFVAGSRILTLHRQVHAVLDAGLEWNVIYDCVFQQFAESGLSLTWADPDTTYEEDVRAFVRALDEKAAPYLALKAATPRGDEHER